MTNQTVKADVPSEFWEKWRRRNCFVYFGGIDNAPGCVSTKLEYNTPVTLLRKYGYSTAAHLNSALLQPISRVGSASSTDVGGDRKRSQDGADTSLGLNRSQGLSRSQNGSLDANEAKSAGSGLLRRKVDFATVVDDAIDKTMKVSQGIALPKKTSSIALGSTPADANMKLRRLITPGQVLAARRMEQRMKADRDRIYAEKMQKIRGMGYVSSSSTNSVPPSIHR